MFETLQKMQRLSQSPESNINFRKLLTGKLDSIPSIHPLHQSKVPACQFIIRGVTGVLRPM